MLQIADMRVDRTGRHLRPGDGHQGKVNMRLTLADDRSQRRLRRASHGGGTTQTHDYDEEEPAPRPERPVVGRAGKPGKAERRHEEPAAMVSHHPRSG